MNNQEKQITNEFLLELTELAKRAPKNISFSILAAENENANPKIFEGVMLVSGKPKKLLTLYNDAFERTDELRQIVFDAVSDYKIRHAFRSNSRPVSIFEMVFGSGFFRR